MPKVKDFEKSLKEHLDTAKEIVKGRKICSNCLGRQFAQLGHGFTNKERGDTILKLLKEKPYKKNDTNLQINIKAQTCEICNNLLANLDKYVDQVLKQLKGMEFKTLLVGTILNQDLLKREESLLEDFPIEFCESIKSEINRELGKLISKKLKKDMDRENPEVNITLNLIRDKIELRVSPLYFYSGYKKLIRGIPQTKWDMYPETVEDIIAEPFMKTTKAEGHSLHGMGREDIDARCLDFRPFVLEIEGPKKRKVDLEKMRKEINKTKKVEVSKFFPTDKGKVREIKEARPYKTYRALVEFENPIKDLEKLKQLKATISQRTPERVAHRRAMLVRKRKVKDIKWKKISEKEIELEVTGEAGLYIKELVSGDKGNTKNSVSEILGNPAKVKELDVIKVWIKK